MSGDRRRAPPRPYAADLANARRFALDTEFMGEGRYRTLLCLVQLAVPDAIGEGERIELLDPLSSDEDFAPLALGQFLAGQVGLLHAQLGDLGKGLFGEEIAAAVGEAERQGIGYRRGIGGFVQET